MHVDEVHADCATVGNLIRQQFPCFADLDIAAVPASGTDNALFRLGDTMVVRLPRTPSAALQIEKQHKFLPILAPHLPLAVSLPLELGQASAIFPFIWSVNCWLPGRDAFTDCNIDAEMFAIQLAHFIMALHGVDTAGGLQPGEHNFFRGVPLSTRDTRTRNALEQIDEIVDKAAVLSVWEQALQADESPLPGVWIHGDLQPGNLLLREGRLSAVIDFGGLAVGDPACDLMVALTLFEGKSRSIFRETLGVDDAAWARARGWAISVALIALPYYLETNECMVRLSRRTIREVVLDVE